MVREPKRVLILGGGFAGMYAALEFERRLRRRTDVEVTLVNRDNFFLFTPMLHEVAASDLDPNHVVNPLRKMLRRTRLFIGRVEHIDLDQRRVVVTHGVDRQHPHELPFDQLILALGSVTNFHGLPGLAGRALTMKSLGDALCVRNRMVENLEEADFECCPATRERMLTFVVAGGGFAGVETVAALNDFVHESLRFYSGLRREEVRVVLVHSGSELLPELSSKLGAYARRKLAARGVDVRLGVRVKAFTDEGVTLTDGSVCPTRTLIWTAGTQPSPHLADLPCGKDGGRILVDACLAVPGRDGVWAVGDCARIPDQHGGFHPPTAQHASREGRLVARNVLAACAGRAPAPFRFRTLGQLASLGRRTGVAAIGGLNFSGFVAWWLWRTIYLMKLPRMERKLRVALDWTLDLLFSKDLVQNPTAPVTVLEAADAGHPSPVPVRARPEPVAVTAGMPGLGLAPGRE